MTIQPIFDATGCNGNGQNLLALTGLST